MKQINNGYLPIYYLKKDGTIYYRSSITYKNKHISLGSYTTEQEAHLTYLEAASILNNDDYSIDVLATRLHTLSFEKAVCLVNFRDNGMYIKTPIYLQKKFFQYYILYVTQVQNTKKRGITLAPHYALT